MSRWCNRNACTAVSVHAFWDGYKDTLKRGVTMRKTCLAEAYLRMGARCVARTTSEFVFSRNSEFIARPPGSEKR